MPPVFIRFSEAPTNYRWYELIMEYTFDLQETYNYNAEIRTALSKTLFKSVELSPELKHQIEQDIALMFDLAVKGKVVENLQRFNDEMDIYEDIIRQTVPDASQQVKDIRDRRHMIVQNINPTKPIHDESDYETDFDFLIDF